MFSCFCLSVGLSVFLFVFVSPSPLGTTPFSLPLTSHVSAFRPDIRSCGAISEHAKLILRKPATERTRQEIDTLSFLVHRLKCLSKYPHIAPKELAAILHYEVFLPDHVLLKQGATACGMTRA